MGDTRTESVCASTDITDTSSEMAESVESESTPHPSMFEMSPSISAVPTMRNTPSIQLFNTPSLKSLASTSISMGSEVSTLDLMPTLSLNSSVSISALPPLPVHPMPIVLPIPNMPITVGVSGTEQLLQWTNQILVNGIHNLGQFEQFLGSKGSKQ